MPRLKPVAGHCLRRGHRAGLFWCVNLLLILLISGVFMVRRPRRRATAQGYRGRPDTLAGSPHPDFRLFTTAGTMAPFSVWPMLLFFLKVGIVMFGSSLRAGRIFTHRPG